MSIFIRFVDRLLISDRLPYWFVRRCYSLAEWLNKKPDGPGPAQRPSSFRKKHNVTSKCEFTDPKLTVIDFRGQVFGVKKK